MIESCNIDERAFYRYKISNHQQVIVKYLELKGFFNDSRSIEQFLYDEPLRVESVSLLRNKAIQYLKDKKVLCPNNETLNRLIAKQRKRVRHRIFDIVHSRLNANMLYKR